MTQGERVKQLRTALDLTLEKFGERVGVGKAAISKLEKNENRLSDQMIKSICREFNVNYDWLVYGEGEMFSELPKTILGIHKDEQGITTGFEGLHYAHYLRQIKKEVPVFRREPPARVVMCCRSSVNVNALNQFINACELLFGELQHKIIDFVQQHLLFFLIMFFHLYNFLSLFLFYFNSHK